MKLKVESEKVGLKFNIQKTKIMAFGPITSWQIDVEAMETVTDFISLGSNITTDGDFSQPGILYVTIYSLYILLSRFGTSLLFHVQFQLLLLDLHTDFSGGRSGGLVFPSVEEFSHSLL